MRLARAGVNHCLDPMHQPYFSERLGCRYDGVMPGSPASRLRERWDRASKRAVAIGSQLQRTARRHASRWLPLVRRGEHAFVVATAILIGALGAYGAIAFRELIRFIHQLFFRSDEYSIGLLEAIPWWQRLLIPTVGGIGVGLIVAFLAPEVRGSGIPEVMEAVARRGGAIRSRVVVAKALAAALTIGSGGSAGREGPIVHIGSAIGSTVGQVLQVSAMRLRTFVACGSAAAIAATFNAPIAGALFAMEVVLGDLAVAHLSPIVISSVVATVISRHYLGDFPAFDVPAYQLLSAKELILYASLGVLAAVVGVIFNKMLYGVGDLFERSPIPVWMRPAVGGFLVGIIALAFPHVFGVGYETINAALWADLGGWILVALVVAKIVATALTLGSGGSGGIFAPSLFLGAVLGASWGGLANRLFPEWTASPGAYALVGMGAMVSATTHAPIAAILIIFELTNDYRIIPPLMLTCVVSVLLSGLLHKESIYTAKLVRRGVRLNEGRDVNLLRAITVAEVMDRNPPTVSANTPYSKVVPQLLAGHHMELLVVDEENRLLGHISLADIRAALPESEGLENLVLAADLADPQASFVLPDNNLDLVMHLFGRIHQDEIAVCDDPESKKVVGLVTRGAVIDAYNRRIFQADLTGSFRSLVDAVQGGRTVEVLGGVYLSEVEVPSSLVGKTLREVDLRRTHGVEVVLIHTAEGAGLEGRPGKLATPDACLQAGDKILVMGTAEAIERVRQ